METDAKGTRLFTNTYDDMGNLIKTVDALGNQENYTYDNMNKLIESIDAMKCSTKYTYDGAGNVMLYKIQKKEYLSRHIRLVVK